MKVNMVVGGRFNAPPMAAALSKLVDLQVYTSVPERYWFELSGNVVLTPHLSMISEKLTRRAPGRKYKDFSTQLFSQLAARIMRSNADVIYGWATFSRAAFLAGKKKGAMTILDRACPHIEFQENILEEESRILGISFQKSSRSFVEKCTDEYALADLIVVPSKYTQRTFSDLGFSKEKVQVIGLGPNYVPKRSFVRKLKSKNEEFVVGVIGGNLIRKGLYYLVKAWRELRLPHSRLFIKCPANELKKSAPLWNEIQQDDSISLVGYLADIEDFYSQCDVFCLPSIDDGFGMVVAESIANGCPVIVSRNVGAADMVVEGETGFVTNIRDHLAIADCLQALYGDREMLTAMSANCVQFSIESTGMSLYEMAVTDLVKRMRSRCP